jgi:diketogulonate reductase-like aldo/keto reductase
VSYSAEHNIVVQAYSPLGNGALISDSKLKAIGAAISPPKSAAQ